MYGMADYDFGWLPESLTIDDPHFRIVQHEGDSGIAYVRNSLRRREGWFLPPLEPEMISANEVFEKTIHYASWFGLPSTHKLTLHHVDDDELAGFLVGTLGVLKGLQLLLDGWGHYYRTPISPGMLTDIIAKPSACHRIIRSAYEFWVREPAVGRLLFGAVHWHLFGFSYEHPFERFATAYAVLDTCWLVHSKLRGIKPGSVLHASRIVEMQTFYDLALPSWATVVEKKSRLSELRNQYFHESRWGGKPIGFAHPKDVPDIHLELGYFNTRLLLAIFGERSDYTRSPIYYQPQRLS
jgi:hypothetical protein